MPEAFLIALFGFPGVLASLLFSSIGIARKSLLLCLLGALLAIPFCYYLGGNPGVGPVAWLLPVFQLGSAWVVRRSGHAWLAWVLLLPLLLTAGWVMALSAMQG